MKSILNTRYIGVSCLFWAFLVALLSSAVAATLPDIALLKTELDPSHAADVQAKLNATGQFTSVTVIDTASVTPTLAQLQAFDAVLIWSAAAYADPVTLGNNLADYHDAGGGVVTAVR